MLLVALSHHVTIVLQSPCRVVSEGTTHQNDAIRSSRGHVAEIGAVCNCLHGGMVATQELFQRKVPQLELLTTQTSSAELHAGGADGC